MCMKLHTAAQLNKRVLMVDHTYLYTPGIRTLKQQVLDGKLGDILAFESRRLNLGIVQRDTNVIWDLGPHDFSILRYIFDEKPTHISATGTRAVSHPTVKTQESTAHVTLFYETFEAHLSLSWVFPLKTRQILVSGSKRTVLYDQCASEPLVALDTRITAKKDVEKGGPLFEYVSEPAVTIPVDDGPGDDLSRMIEDFLSCVQSGGTPVAHATQAVEVVAMLRAAEESLVRGGEKTVICYVSDGNSDMSQKPEPELDHGK